MIKTVEYRSEGCRHRDHFYADGVNLWRDWFPEEQLAALVGMAPRGRGLSDLSGVLDRFAK